MGKLAVIHRNPGVAWQVKRGAFFAEGFKKAGIESIYTESRTRLDEGFPVLLGTTFWRGVEGDGGQYLLVDRCSFGDTEVYVSLVWNGHGRRGDHRLPDRMSPSRFETMGVDILPWKPRGQRVIVCGQTEPYSPHYRSLKDWYRAVQGTHFRPHPADQTPPPYPVAQDFDDCVAVTLNSSIGVKCVLNGIPTITMDEGAMAWPVTGHDLGNIITPDRDEWAHKLAYTQWSDDEIKEGKLWDCRW